MSGKIVLLLCSAPTARAADLALRGVIGERLAACVNLAARGAVCSPLAGQLEGGKPILLADHRLGGAGLMARLANCIRMMCRRFSAGRSPMVCHLSRVGWR